MTTNKDLNASNSNIIFEAADFKREVELIIFEHKGKRFQIHLWDSKNDKALICELDKNQLMELYDSIYSFAEPSED